MPYIKIQVTDEGVTKEQKNQLIKASTEMMETILNKSAATTFVVIEEVNMDNWGVAGTSVRELRAQKQT